MRWSARWTPRASRRALRVPATTIVGEKVNPSRHQSEIRISQSAMEGVPLLVYNACHYGTHAHGAAPRLSEPVAFTSGARPPLRAPRRRPVHAGRRSRLRAASRPAVGTVKDEHGADAGGRERGRC